MLKKTILISFLSLLLFIQPNFAANNVQITELNDNYNRIISNYQDALSQRWSDSQLVKYGLYPFLTMDNFQSSECGYFTRDVDGNGIEELFIVRQSPTYKGGQNFIIDSYTIENGKLKQLFRPTSQSEIFQIVPDGRFLYETELYDDLYHLSGSEFVLEESRFCGGFGSQFQGQSVSYYPFNMLNASVNNATPIYRVYNMFNGEHLYSSDLSECAILMSRGWSSEGVSWIAPNEGTPVYRLCSPDGGQHLFTTDENEVATLTSQHGWTADNGAQPLFYSGGDIPIFRLYDTKTGQHLLTRDVSEYNSLPGLGWKQEGSPISAIS